MWPVELDKPSEQFGDERDLCWRSDTPEDFADHDFKSLVEAVLYTDQGMFGSIQFEAERELYRRLMGLFPVPDWAKGKI